MLKLERASLPPDAEFKGYEEVVVQELRFVTDNVKFRKEKYYAASTGRTYLAPLPAGYRGEFGPNLKSLCVLFSHLCNMTEPKIADRLENLGMRDLQRPNIGVAHGRIPGNPGGKASNCGSRIE